MKRLKELRQERNLTQQELGKLLDVSGQTILNWENDINDPPIPKLIKISKLFNVSVDYLLGVQSNETNYEKIKNILGEYEKEELINLIASFVDNAFSSYKDKNNS